ncbi:SprB-like repeat protein [Gelidibacter algens]|uniref:SprB-like repeat protein n=1 Tax=Gelidibacter algens TaxID=49280 RepID=A0A1A7R2G9_9FLAO|nr:SprB repeat-containing protein [Gelidibacter algens]OBX24972.1 hypothetical protein A9996_12275 [Gelidibacter algens]RAJ19820.1 SprB-like repeat protein [Gelidibacter algens]
MKNKTLLIVMLFFAQILYSQTYEIKLNFWYKVDRNVKNKSSSNMTIRLYYSDNTSEEIYSKSIGDDTYQGPVNLNLSRNKRPINFKVTGFVNFSDVGDADWNHTLPLNSGCITEQRYTYRHSGFQNDRINFDYSSRPIIKIPEPGADNNFPEDEVLTLTASSGFLSSVYNWEYSINNGANYRPIPSVNQNRRNVEILGGQFLDKSYHGKIIYFRVNTGCNYSNSVPYRFLISAPHFLSPNPNPTSCYDKGDGSVRLSFSRVLKQGEVLSITSSNNNFPSGKFVNLVASDFDSNQSILIENLKPGIYPVAVAGFFNGFNTYIESSSHKTSFTIEDQPPVEFTVETTNVNCNGGSDGTITISATGGNGSYTYQINDSTPQAFTNGKTHIETGLPQGWYTINIKDTNGCLAQKILRDGNGKIIGPEGTLEESREITQPDAALSVEFSTLEDGGIKEPTAYGFSNGTITAKINGGTKLPNDTYNFTWEYFDDLTASWVNWTDFNYAYDAPDDWYIILQNAKGGNYKLTVTDKYGCTVTNQPFTLGQPPQLSVSISETNAISCNNTNIFGDDSSDGELTAIGTGGVPLKPTDNKGLPYYYKWKKKDANGVYQEIIGADSNVLSNRDAGDYAVNIIDANGITVGTAINNVVTPVDVLMTLTQPDLLQITFNKVDVFCHGGKDGSIHATIIGGTPFDSGGYTIKWNTGAQTEAIDTLVAGTYTIIVTDKNDCRAQASITIDQPAFPLVINYTAFFAPTYTGATNGWIEATVTGGTPLNSGTYTYIWKDANGNNLNAQVTQTIYSNSYVIKLNGLAAGVYDLTIEDGNYPLAIDSPKCTISNSPYTLHDPKPLTVEIQEHKPISCHSTNAYGTQSSDGALRIIADGGVKLQPTDNKGMPYYYTWKKEMTPGVWTELTGQITDIATNLDAGNYAVNIKDANGIVLGIYHNNVLITPTDTTYVFEEPPLLELTIEKQDVYCYNGSDGWAKTIITGGTPPYNIVWSSEETSERISYLNQGVYNVTIMDSRGVSS